MEVSRSFACVKDSGDTAHEYNVYFEVRAITLTP